MAALDTIGLLIFKAEVSGMSQPVVVLACKVFQHLIEKYLPPGQSGKVIFLDYGLHRVPNQLREAVQDQLDDLSEPSLVILGYGLCGNGLKGIRAGMHTLVIPRTDDCIAILLGSYQAYKEIFSQEPGTYYLTKGWLESGSNPLKEYEELLLKYGQEKADLVMDLQYKNYKRLIFVAHQQSDLDAYRAQAQEVARYCERWGMVYEEILGSEAYIEELMTWAQQPQDPGEAFLVVPPGGELTQDKFLRM